MLLLPRRGKTHVPKLQAAALLFLFRALMHLLLLQYIVPPFHPNKENPPQELVVGIWGESGVSGHVLPLVVLKGLVDGEQPGVIVQ